MASKTGSSRAPWGSAWRSIGLRVWISAVPASPGIHAALAHARAHTGTIDPKRKKNAHEAVELQGRPVYEALPIRSLLLHR